MSLLSFLVCASILIVLGIPSKLKNRQLLCYTQIITRGIAMDRYCLYYQAHVPVSKCGIFVALMRSVEHVAFDRTCDIQTSTFEFFVPNDQRAPFIQFMTFCEEQKLIDQFVELPNRFEQSVLD